jgi:hypothetical protein
MADIFLSYSRDEKPRVEPFVRLFEQQGWSVWWDAKIGVGERFPKTIQEELGKAKCVVVFWSKLSVDSDWVLNEASEGAERHLLVPVLLDPVRIPLGFRHIQAADLARWNNGRIRRWARTGRATLSTSATTTRSGGEGKEDVESQAYRRRAGVESLRDRNERHSVGLEVFDHLLRSPKATS